jgi:HEPN domain-containing protein
MTIYYWRKGLICMSNIASASEWIKQSDYDMDTAKYMFNGGRYAYAVFICHLAVEKALKGLYHQRTCELSPKTHNLIYLLAKLGVKPEREMVKSITILNQANIATRYPESLEVLQRNYTKAVVSKIIKESE